MKSPRLRPSLSAFLFLSTGAFSALHADVRMPALFGDHMVLQQEARIQVWGWADPGERVTVAFGGQTATGTAASDGAWRVTLPPVAPTTQGGTLTVAGKNALVFQDVLAGDVWVASGQSNMEYGINKKEYAEAIDKAEDAQLRLFFVPKTTALVPQADLPANPADPLAAKWVLCTPENLRKINGQGFATAAYFFAREIRARTGRPLGMIESSWGGTRAEAWTSLSGLSLNPPFGNYLKIQAKNAADYPALKETYEQRKSEHDAALQKWNEEVGKPWEAAQKEWKTAVLAAQAAGQPVPPAPIASRRRPDDVHTPDGGSNGPANLFNAMIAPLMPFAIRGVIWYQGEFNSGYDSGREYATLFPRMISDWRAKWGQGDFPFIYVQLPNFGPVDAEPSVEGGGWRWVREGQLKALALPQTAMAVAIDIGDPFQLHPPDKLDVGLRLALAARRLVYGENVVASGPLYDAMTVEGNKIRLTFRERGAGLALGVSPYRPDGKAPPVPTELRGFGIAGDDRTFVRADAVIDGDTVVVSSGKVAAPVAVRYDFSNSPQGNLYNKEGLPASPFRTDDWDGRER